MLDAWLKSKFYARCKAKIKLALTRIEMVKRKRNAMLKHLKNDVADLLKTGFDVNAYSRTEGLLLELNLSRCYDLLEQYCEHISNNLGIMYKQRECPEECREAVSTLIFAAARFADLPELRQLRSVFTERYGKFLECHVSKEFLQRLKSVPPTKDMKLQLMQDIASESGIEWNMKALEQTLYDPLVPEQDWPKDESAHKKDSEASKFNRQNMWQVSDSKDKAELNSSFWGKVVPDDEHNLPMRRESYVSDRKSNDSPRVRVIEMDSTGGIEEDKPVIDRIVPEDKKPFRYMSISPPYTKSRASLTKNTWEISPTSSDGEEGNCKNDTVEKANPKPKSVRRRRLDSTEEEEEPVDEEERLLDRLLMYFSTKRFQKDINKPESSEVSRRRNVGNRPTSLPVELEQTSLRELNKGHARANSFQPDMLSSNRHVHPKLPDYDDFVAQLASLKQKSKD